jgi:hypothetical protein
LATAGTIAEVDGRLDELGVERDLGVQNLGDRAVLLGVFSHFGEFGFVEVRDFRAQSEGGPTMKIT